MKTRSLRLALGLAVFFVASLFNYSRSVNVDHATTRWNIDGGGLALVALGIALFVICRHITQTVRAALSRAGLPAEIRIPKACWFMINASIPFCLFGYGTSFNDATAGISKSFGFGMSSLKIAVLALIFLTVWLIALLQRLRDLTEHLRSQSSGIPSR